MKTTAVSIAVMGLVVGSILLGSPAAASPGQQVDDGSTLSPDALAGVLLGGGVAVSNVTYTGSPFAVGRFSGMGALGIDEGLVLSSGSVTTGDGRTSTILGPNDDDGVSGVFGAPGDADLTAIVGETTFDAAVLEFDFVPTTDTIRFEFVFGSEEYNEYVFQYNDAFAFLINGVNCAMIETPGGPEPITINNINNVVNAHLYRDNEYVDESSTPAYDTQLDGFTVELTCAATVTPDAVNHAKLAVADAGDNSYDSAVMIRGGSFTANLPPVAQDRTVTTSVDVPVATPLVGTDANGDALEYTVLSPPLNGTLTGTGPDLLFTPDPGWTGTTSFTYQVSDGVATSAVATVTITVSATAPAGETPDDELPPTGISGLLPLTAALAAIAGGALLRRSRRG